MICFKNQDLVVIIETCRNLGWLVYNKLERQDQ